MAFDGKDSDSLDEKDLESLIAEKVREGRDLDYKRELPGDASGERREFLKEVSSFAKAAGSFLVYGMEQENGEPNKIVGISDKDPEGEVLPLENLIQVASEKYERLVCKAVDRYLRLLTHLNIPPPFLCVLSLLGAKGYYIRSESFPPQQLARPIHRDALLIPDVMIESFDCDAAAIMKPAFDVIWNASGLPGSENYDAQGKWRRSR